MGILPSLRRVAKSCGIAEESTRSQKGVAQGSEDDEGGAQHDPPPGPGRAERRGWANEGEPLGGVDTGGEEEEQRELAAAGDGIAAADWHGAAPRLVV